MVCATVSGGGIVTTDARESGYNVPFRWNADNLAEPAKNNESYFDRHKMTCPLSWNGRHFRGML